MMANDVDITLICQSTSTFDIKTYRIIVDSKTWGATKDVKPSFVVKFQKHLAKLPKYYLPNAYCNYNSKFDMHNNPIFLHTYVNIVIKKTLISQMEYGRKIQGCTSHSHLCTILLGNSFLQTLKTCVVNPCHPYFHTSHFFQFALSLTIALEGNPLH